MTLMTSPVTNELTRLCEYQDDLNTLRAKFFRVNINMSLHFMSFLHIDMTHVLKIIPQIR